MSETPQPDPDPGTAEALNHSCYCRTLNSERLRAEIERDPSLQGLMQSIVSTRPHLFASTVVFLGAAIERAIIEAVQAIERVVALPAYAVHATARAPAIAHHAFGPQGACMGYDFHWSVDGPKLIEINTNAGGLLLNAALARAQEACCEAMRWTVRPQSGGPPMDDVFVAMFRAEWQLQRGGAPLRTIAIVDDAPSDQYLAPEFALFRQLFLRDGITALVADPAELAWRDGRLWHGDQAIDLVYNRLTDFYLDAPAHSALRQAYQAGAVVLTPGPRTHALYADKRNLITLGQADLLTGWGASAADVAVLQATVPTTELVTPSLADALWARRRQLFFKPVAGYGAKAAYRGDKLTKRVWADILAGDFVAQALVPPSQRLIDLEGVHSDLKFDIRAYTYAGEVQLMAARLYAGQTTNFRTDGGGFAPIVVV